MVAHKLGLCLHMCYGQGRLLTWPSFLYLLSGTTHWLGHPHAFRESTIFSMVNPPVSLLVFATAERSSPPLF